MPEQFNIIGKSASIGCNAIALFINSDGFRKKDGSLFTGEDIWHSNSHGELFGVFCALEFIQKIINKIWDEIPSLLQVSLLNIQDSNGSLIMIDMPTGIGQRCCELLWRCPWG